MTAAAKDLLHVLGYLYLRYGQHRRALALIQLAAAAAPDDPGVMKSLALALIMNNEADDALEVIRTVEAGRLAPAPELRLLESRALLLKGETAAARRCFRRFVDQRKDIGADDSLGAAARAAAPVGEPR